MISYRIPVRELETNNCTKESKNIVHIGHRFSNNFNIVFVVVVKKPVVLKWKGPVLSTNVPVSMFHLNFT